MPEGAISFDLENDAIFSDYLEANIGKWYEFVYKVCEHIMAKYGWSLDVTKQQPGVLPLCWVGHSK